MFSFNFDIQDPDVDEQLAASTSTLQLESQATATTSTTTTAAAPHRQIPFATLLATLPPLLSYTPVLIPLTSNTSNPRRSRTLLRRDLFDARFQVLSQDEPDNPLAAERTEMDHDNDEEADPEKTYVDEDTDLVKGVYEGGLKTWECSLDLVDCLDGKGFGEEVKQENVRGKRVLELGCGTALPTCSLFSRLLSEIRQSPTDPSSSERPPRTVFHMQDYNKQVLSLITLPNLLLTYAQHLSSGSTPDADEDVLAPEPGELDVTPEFLASFESLLDTENIELVFFEGAWETFTVDAEEDKYDLVLTSETVYELDSLDSLIRLLRTASRPGKDSTCLVACKKIYFGVGGGELEFRRRVEQVQGTVETVWGQHCMKGRITGVGRVIMQVEW